MTTVERPCAAVPAGAAELVRRAELDRLERREAQARMLLERASRIVGAIPEEEATDADLDYVTATYTAWVTAWEELAAARAAHGNQD